MKHIFNALIVLLLMTGLAYSQTITITAASSSGITGLTAGKVSKASNSTTIVDSAIYENGGNVGIGSTSPRGALDTGTGLIYGDGSNLINMPSGMSGLTPGKISKSLTPTMIVDSAIYESAGNVGVGSTSPRGKMDIGTGLYYGDGSQLINLPSSGGIGGLTPGKLPKSTTATTVADSLIYDSGIYVGIGTTAPVSPLQIVATNTQTSGVTKALSITPTYNQVSGTAANTDFLINRTQTAVGSGTQLLMDAQVGGVSKFNVDNNGNITTTAILTAPILSANGAGTISLSAYPWNNGNSPTSGDLTGFKFGGGSSQNIRLAGTHNWLSINPTYNQTSGTAANTDFLINRTQTAVGSGAQLLMDAQVGGVSKFNVDSNGNITTSGSGNTAMTFSSTSAGSNLTLNSGSGNIGLLGFSDAGTQKFVDYYYSGFYVQGSAYNAPIIKIDRTAGQSIYITAASNVGIGTTATAPSQKLEVDGNVYVQGTGAKIKMQSPDGTIWSCQPANTTGVFTCA